MKKDTSKHQPDEKSQAPEQISAVEKIPISKIDDPEAPMRSQMDETQLQELALSIENHGLLQPILVMQKGDRYEVIAGHRRLAAHRVLDKPYVEAIVREFTAESGESAKLHENLYREDINPVDEAIFLARFAERSGKEIPEIAEVINRSETWVRSRLDILYYPDYLKDALYNGKLSLGAAAELAQIQDPHIRKEYSRIGALQGINVRTARHWKQQADRGTLPEDPDNVETLEPETDEEPTKYIGVCLLCKHKSELKDLETQMVHKDCAIELNNAMQEKQE